MKKSLIKTALLAVVLMSVFLYLSSCQKHQPIYSDIESDTRESNHYPADYSLIYLDGGYYLKPENESDISSYEKSDSMDSVPSITFSDINSLISTIRNTSFSEA